MPKYGLPIRFSFFVFLLLTGGMLLIDVVASGFWLHHTLKERQRHMEAAIQLYSRFPENSLGRDLLSQYCLYVFTENRLNASDACLEKDEYRNLALHATGGNFSSDDPLWIRRLMGTAVLEKKQNNSGSSSILILVEQGQTAWQHILSIHRYIIVYILVNGFILAVVFFFRFNSKVIRPLNRIAYSAESEQIQDTSMFLPVDNLSEMQQISFNLHAMLRRLKEDRATLQMTARELSRKNEQLLANKREMIRTEKLAATGRLAAGLAHEIGNPLGVVQGYLELLQMEEVPDHERQEYCRNALRETERMHTLITHLLQTARTSSAAGELIDMHRLLAEYVAVLRPQALFRGIEVQLRLEADNALVVAEDAAMRQVLLNALLNAVDAIRFAGTEQGCIVVSTRQREREGRVWLDVCVSDNGSGLAPEHAAQIFDPFFTTKEPGKGTGLGLSVSLALVESMGGCLYAVNREEGGMVLHIELPQAMPVMPEEPHVEA